jgi:hypothetical protein
VPVPVLRQIPKEFMGWEPARLEDISWSSNPDFIVIEALRDWQYEDFFILALSS